MSESVECIQVGNRVYDLGDILGVGGFSEVRKGVDKDTRKRVALKIMYQDGQGQDLKSQLFQVQQEIKAMKKLNHPNLIRLLGYDLKCKVGDRKAIVMVQQLAPKGELFDYLMYTKKFEEPQAIALLKQLISGLQAMHDSGIAHRDLKPENLLFDNQFQLKIADFGFSKVFQKKGSHKTAMSTELGTKGYMAPEILTGRKYTEKADVFAAGVILFIMLAGFPPFQNADSKDWWFDKITKKKYKLFWMAHERTAKFSSEAKELLQKMLAATEKDRITVHEIQETAFFNKECLTKEEIAKALKRRKVDVDSQKAAERAEANRDILFDILIPEGEVLPNQVPVLLKDLLKNNMADDLNNVTTKKDLRKVMFNSMSETDQLFKGLSETFNDIEEQNAEAVAKAFSSLSEDREVSPADLQQVAQDISLTLDENQAEAILKRLHTTQLGEIDDWVVASRFAELDNHPLPAYDPPVHKSFTYKTKIGFGMLGYCVSSFINKRGQLTVLQRKNPGLKVEMAFKKKVVLPNEEVDKDGKAVIKFRQGKIPARLEMLISIYHDPISMMNMIVFENTGGAFAMQEFASTVKELTENRTYYLAHFLEAEFDPSEEHLQATEIDWEVNLDDDDEQMEYDEEEVAPAEVEQ